MDEKAAPLEEKAIGAVKNALKLAHENHVYNKWSKKAAALLAKLSPELFPVLEDAVVNTEWTVPATFSTTFIANPGAKLKQAPPPEPEPAPVAPGAPGAPGAEGSAPADSKAPAQPDAKAAGGKS